MAKPVKGHKVVPCFFHQDRESTTRCYTCNKALCQECAKTYDGEVYCSPQCAENAKKFESRVDDLQESEANYKTAEAIKNRQAFMINLIIGLILFAVLVFVWISFVPNDAKLKLVNSLPSWAGILKDILKP